MGNKCDSLFKLIKDGDDVTKFKKKYTKKINRISNKDFHPQEYTCKNYNLLHYASKKGRLSIICYLLQQEFDINKQMINGFTSLHCALKQKKIEVSLLLIDSGADVNILTSDNISCLMLAATIPCMQCVKRIIQGYDISMNIMTYKEGYTALCYSVESGDLEISLFLIEMGSDVLHMTKSSESLLDISRKSDNINEQLIEYLSEHIDEDSISKIKKLSIPSLKQSSGSVISVDNQIDSIGNFTVHDSEISRTPRSPEIFLINSAENRVIKQPISARSGGAGGAGGADRFGGAGGAGRKAPSETLENRDKMKSLNFKSCSNITPIVYPVFVNENLQKSD